jgi:archaellum component FlaG (FlaF/FlaG flagellin family)
LKRILIVAAVLAATIVPNVPAHAGSVGFSAEPATSSGQIDKGRSRFDYQLEPGSTTKDQIYVMNMGSQPILLTVYANDAQSLSDGTYDVGTLDQIPTGAGSWVKFDNGATSTTIALKNQEAIAVPFEVHVPKDAQPGDHVAGIAVQSGGLGSGQIKIAQRIVTRLYARVPGALTPQLTISNLTSSYTPSLNPFAGSINMSFTISNPGNVALKADVVTSATTFFGIPVGSSAHSQVEELTPGTNRVYSVVVPNVGQWVLVSPKVSLTPIVDKTALNPGVMTVVEREASVWVFPFTWIAVLVLILVLVIVFRASRANRRRQVATWIEAAEAEAKQKVTE